MNDETPSLPSLEGVPIELFEKRGNKITKLIANKDGDNHVTTRRDWYSLKLTKPIFVKSIELHTQGFVSTNSVEFIISHASGDERTIKQNPVDEKFTVRPDAFITGFSFKPAYAFTPKTLTAIHLQGYPNSSFCELETALHKMEASRDELAEEKVEIERLREQEAAKIDRRTELNEAIADLKVQAIEAQANTNTIEERQAYAEATLKDINSNVSIAQDKLRELRSDIEKSETALRRVTKEVRLFPVDQEGFVREGGRNIRNYLLLSIPFVLVICFVTFQLLSGAVELSVLINNDYIKIDIWTVFLTRLPFVLLAITLLEVCGYVVGRFIFEVMKINRQRLDIAKLAIIAKDVSDASGYDTDLTDDELWERNTALKMELLREHLKEEVGEEFKYQGTAAQSALKAAISRVGRSKAPDSETSA